MNNDIYRVQNQDTYTLYTKNGLKHRIDGPALIIDDHNYYYINGEHLTMGEHANWCETHMSYDRQTGTEEEYYDLAMQSSDGIYVNLSS